MRKRITKRAENRICADCAEESNRLRRTILGKCFIDERRVTERHDPISRAPVCGVCGLEKTHSFEFVEMPKPVVYRVPLQLTIFLSAGDRKSTRLNSSHGYI